MGIKSVYYFRATYGYDDDNGWMQRHEYGFIEAEDFVAASQRIVDYYRNDLISFEIEEIGDSMIIIDNKELAEAFRKSYIKTHYGDDEEE